MSDDDFASVVLFDAVNYATNFVFKRIESLDGLFHKKKIAIDEYSKLQWILVFEVLAAAHSFQTVALSRKLTIDNKTKLVPSEVSWSEVFKFFYTLVSKVDAVSGAIDRAMTQPIPKLDVYLESLCAAQSSVDGACERVPFCERKRTGKCRLNEQVVPKRADNETVSANIVEAMDRSDEPMLPDPGLSWLSDLYQFQKAMAEETPTQEQIESGMFAKFIETVKEETIRTRTDLLNRVFHTPIPALLRTLSQDCVRECVARYWNGFGRRLFDRASKSVFRTSTLLRHCAAHLVERTDTVLDTHEQLLLAQPDELNTKMFSKQIGLELFGLLLDDTNVETVFQRWGIRATVPDGYDTIQGEATRDFVAFRKLCTSQWSRHADLYRDLGL